MLKTAKGKSQIKKRRSRYLWEAHVRPEIERAHSKGLLDDAAYEAEIARGWDSVTDVIDVKVTERATPLDILAGRMSNLGEDVVNTGLYDKSLADDFYNYMDSLIDNTANMMYAHNMLKQPDVLRAGQAVTPTDVSLFDAWEGAKFGRQGMYKALMDREDVLARVFQGNEEVMDQLVPQMKARMQAGGGKGTLEDLGDAATEVVARLEEEAQTIFMPKGAADTLKTIQEAGQYSKRGDLVKLADRFLALQKSYLTIPWASFHTRNLMSGFWQSWSDGQLSFLEVMRGYKEAMQHVQSRGAKPMEFIDEIQQLNIGGSRSRIVDIQGEEGLRRQEEVPEGFLGGIFNFRQPGRTTREAFDPLQVRGVRDVPEGAEDLTQNVIMSAGDKAYGYVEFLNRAGYYNALRKKGFTPAQAKHYVTRSQFDYSELSNIEKNVFRRLVPFYSWQRKSAPYTIQKLLERPGGRTAQTIRAVSSEPAPDEGDVYRPSFLRERVSVPVGGTEEAQVFMKQAGLPVEDLNNLVLNAGVPSMRTIEKLAATSHPLAVGLIENLSDRQLFSGRDLKTLRSPTEELTGALPGVPATRLEGVDQLIGRGPLSRVYTELGQPAVEELGGLNPEMTWTQRLANAFTGMKFATYDTKKWRAIDLSDSQRKLLEQTPEIRSGSFYYANPLYKDTPKGEDLDEQLRLSRSLDKLMRQVRDEQLDKKEREQLTQGGG
jgi:hypothetical protein